ncbi:MAG: DNA primase catalytic subunit PriS [Candidatus Hadarchaeota archaeon]
MLMRASTPEERKRFYAEEWNKREVPDFILHTLSLREFGFDLDGTGPSHRYIQFRTLEQLEEFMRYRAPFSAYSSVALYERPSMREGWLKAELVLDIDAKDLPVKSCGCEKGSVCEVCLDEARKVAAEFADTLRSDLGLRVINFVYSGRGFHIRVNEEAVMGLEQNERGQVVSYVTGGKIPSDITMALGYSKVFRERAARTLEKLNEGVISGAIKSKAVAQKLLAEKSKVVESMRAGRIGQISMKGVGPGTISRLLELLARLNSEFTDGKVTIDTKRILRLPSSLHSGVSMKCMVVKDIDKFNPEDAVPRFMRGAS